MSNPVNYFTKTMKELLTTPEFIYFLGYIWADGNLAKDGNRLSLEIVKDDMDTILPIFKKILKINNIYERSRFRYNKPCRTTSNLMVTDICFANFLRSCGFGNRKAGESPLELLKKIKKNLWNFWL